MTERMWLHPASASAPGNNRTARLLSLLNENLSRSNQLHLSFLRGQQQALNLIVKQGLFSTAGQNSQVSTPIISRSQLQEFGTGSIAACFGSEFSSLDDRDSPRIPNGDLLMIDRITAINGTRRVLKPPAHLTAEYDVPQKAWFLLENSYPGVPLSLLLEMALQPCGILSAFLGTSLMLPPENNRFRNLDGELHFYQAPQLPGNTITNNVTLLDAISSGGMHIQKFAFELFVNRSLSLSGNSSFGYFTKMAMRQQAGLGEQGSRNQSHCKDSLSLNKHLKSSRHFNLVDEVQFIESAGRYGNGLVTGKKQLNGSEWFYSNHFYKDPVMPGSLGLEAIMLGVWAFVSHHGYDRRFTDPILDYSDPKPFTWKYRGQVIPANRSINFQAHIKELSIKDNSIFLSVDASFWVDGMRIYEFKDLGFSIKGGNL